MPTRPRYQYQPWVGEGRVVRRILAIAPPAEGCYRGYTFIVASTRVNDNRFILTTFKVIPVPFAL